MKEKNRINKYVDFIFRNVYNILPRHLFYRLHKRNMNWKIILSLILLIFSAVTAVVDYVVDNNILTVLSIIFVVNSVIFFAIGMRQNKRKKNMEKQKIDNKFLLEKQLETLKLFLERNLITQEQYEYEVQVLTTRINIKDSE